MPLVLGAASFLLVLGGCNRPITGGQTGDGSGVLPEPEVTGIMSIAPGDCDYVERAVDAGEETPLGFRPDALLGYAEATFETDLEWLEEPSSGVGYGPGGSSALQLSIAASARAPKVLEPVAGDAGAGPLCPPLLAVPVTVTVVSEDGGLDESVETELRASTDELAEFRVRIPKREFRGSLQLRDAPHGVELESVSLTGFVSARGTAGSVDVVVSGPEESSAGFAGGMAAHWPRASCDDSALGWVTPALVVTPGTKVRGQTFYELLDTMEAVSPVSLRWSDGRETQFHFELESAGPVCATPVDGALRLRGGASIRAWTDDGVLEGTLPGRLSDDTLGETLRSYLSSDLHLPPSEFAQLVTFQGIAFDQYDRVDFSLGLSGGDAPAGSLTLSGSSACETEPPAAELQSCSSPLGDAGLGALPEISPSPLE